MADSYERVDSYKGYHLEVKTESDSFQTKKWWTVVFPDNDQCQMFVGYTVDNDVTSKEFKSFVNFHKANGYIPDDDQF